MHSWLHSHTQAPGTDRPANSLWTATRRPPFAPRYSPQDPVFLWITPPGHTTRSSTHCVTRPHQPTNAVKTVDFCEY